MNETMRNKALSSLLAAAMLVQLTPISAFAEEAFNGETSLDVTAEGKTYSLFMKDNLENQSGTTFLYVVKSGDRFYTPKHPGVDEFGAYDYMGSVDITSYWDEETNTFSGIPDDTSAAVMQYQTVYNDSWMYLDDDILLKIMVPFENSEDEWFGEIQYYTPDGTYSYARPLWEAYGDGSGYFYDSYIDLDDVSGEKVYGALDFNPATGHFALRNISEEIVDGETPPVKAWLYAAPCGHAKTNYHAYDAATCMEKGCKEYWYCSICDTYFKDEAMTDAYGAMPVIPATGHDWNSSGCGNCGRDLPVYTKVTNQSDFDSFADDTMYILVAEYNSKHYSLDIGDIQLYVSDSDGDGFRDIYDVDENGNDVPDMFEEDWDENGVYDYLENDYDYDDDVDEYDWLLYHEELCFTYIADRLYRPNGIGAMEISVNPDGTISHEAVKDSLEFEMINTFSDEEIDWYIEDGYICPEYRYGYECSKQFVIPNMFVSAPSMMPQEREYLQDRLEVGDTSCWGVLFVNSIEDYPIYNEETESFDTYIEFPEVAQPDSVAVFSIFKEFYPESEDRHQALLRLRDYEGQLSFIAAYPWELEGSEYVDDENGGHFDTHDTQACIYLYASESGNSGSHTCNFGPWTDDEVSETHTRRCDCGASETQPHNWDEGTEVKAPTCTEAGEIRYSCPDCGAEKVSNTELLEHNWTSWSDDGTGSPADTHSRSCQYGCGTTEQEVHSWGSWTSLGETEHQKVCAVCSGTRSDIHLWDDGVITTPPTEDAEGIKTYTCSQCAETKTEAVDKLVHECVWSDWIADGDENHKRECMDENCDLFETLPHSWDEGEVTTEPTCTANGVRTFTCQTCMHTRTEEIPAVDHQWGEWNHNDDETHSRTCSCGAVETDNCVWDEGHITSEPTHVEEGIRTYTCTICKGTKTEMIPANPEHLWGDWYYTDQEIHSRECKCGEIETQPHNWIENPKDPNSHRLCSDCGAAEEIPLSAGDINGDGEIDSADVNFIYRYVMDYTELTDEQFEFADVNDDGKVNSADVNMLYRFIMGYLEELVTPPNAYNPI